MQAIAGHAIGTGHFARAAAVANALDVYDDLRVTLVTNQTAAGLANAYFPTGVDVIALDDTDLTPPTVLKALKDRGVRPKAIYLDQYGVLKAWEDAAITASIPLVVIDDLREAENADWIIRPIADQTPPPINVMDGPAYLPLTADVTKARFTDKGPKQKVQRLNICFGGSDPTGETLKALEAVSTLDQIEVDVVIGPRNPIAAAELARFAKYAHLHFHHAPTPTQTIKLLQNADLAIGAGGVMQWERLCIGVPSLVVIVADNQNPQVAWMLEHGAIHLLGEHQKVTPAIMHDALVSFINDPAMGHQMSKTGAALVDGRGAMRIAAIARAACFAVRPVTAEDAQNLYDWRTHPSNWQFNLSNAQKPDFASHLAWLSAKLTDPHCQFMIVQQDAAAVAVVRFDISADERNAALSIYLVPQCHGQKLGLAVYIAAERALRAARPSINEVTSDIHAQNAASQRMHTDAGFVMSSTDDLEWLVGRRSFS